MNNKRIQELEEKIADLKKRWPAHSVPPAMLQELDDLEEDIVRAAKVPGGSFHPHLPKGYDTVLNEEASNISQGQKQLLTIARAFLVDPQILILDEATSSVDTRTEMQIQQAMADLMKGRTSFVIAHRLSTIRNADLILVMNHGAIIEKGTHEELLAANGFYADLYTSQFLHQELLVNAGSEPAPSRYARSPSRATPAVALG